MIKFTDLIKLRSVNIYTCTFLIKTRFAKTLARSTGRSLAQRSNLIPLLASFSFIQRLVTGQIQTLTNY